MNKNLVSHVEKWRAEIGHHGNSPELCRETVAWIQKATYTVECQRHNYIKGCLEERVRTVIARGHKMK